MMIERILELTYVMIEGARGCLASDFDKVEQRLGILVAASDTKRTLLPHLKRLLVFCPLNEKTGNSGLEPNANTSALNFHNLSVQRDRRRCVNLSLFRRFVLRQPSESSSH